jgi:hypothetical protein
MSPKAWLRRLGVASITAATSFVLMTTILITSLIYDEAVGPVLQWLNGANVEIKRWIAANARGSYALEVLANVSRTHLNFVHIALSIPAVAVSILTAGKLFNWMFGGSRTWKQQIGIALGSVPISLAVVVLLFAMNLWSPATYSFALDSAEYIWQGTLRFLETYRADVAGLGKALNLVYQHQGAGHHFIFMAVGTLIGTVIMNGLYALFARRS